LTVFDSSNIDQFDFEPTHTATLARSKLLCT
jgi:hypothetical protein